MALFTMKRMRRLFRKDGRSVIVALDHGAAMNVLPDLKDTPSVLRAIVENGADAVLTSFGILKDYWEILEDTPVILRLDGGITSFGTGTTRYSQLYTVEDALRLGADGVACMGLPGCDYENDTLSYLAGICAEARRWNLPVLAEMLPGGFGHTARAPEHLAFAARVGVELGADIIKTEYSGNPDDFKEMVEGVKKPVVVLGGAKSERYEEIFQRIRSAIDAGASGIAVGRNIWGYKEPGKMTAALSAIVHGQASVESALHMLQ